jgi:hypothetical protein
MKIVSFGGGVQSTAMVVLAAQGKIEVDAFVFSDTGFEQSIVFDFLEKYTLPMLEKAGIPFYIAKCEEFAGKLHGKTTYANWLLPPFFHLDGDSEIGRLPAYCSTNWKRKIIERFLKKEYDAKRYELIMGFSIYEMHRAGRMKSTKKYQYKFPLLDLKMSRGDCVALVNRTFNAPPPRSSCYFCPNHTQHEWHEVMNSKDREKVIEVDRMIRTTILDGVTCYLTADCKPIDEIEFDEKNESIFSRFCAGGCFL